MMQRLSSCGLALVLLSAGAGCTATKSETPERCIERFEDLDVANILGDARFEPVFTYDTTEMEHGLEALLGDAANAEGATITVAHGSNAAAVEAFYQAEVPPKGALFAGDDLSLYRIKGTPGTREETISAGCRSAPSKARLIRIQWTAISPKAEV